MMDKKDIVCISCPIGCNLHIEFKGDEVIVTGNRCKRGENYAVNEIKNPLRVVTSNIRVKNGKYPLASVKTDGAISKNNIFDLIEALKCLSIEAPVRIGDVVIENFKDSGINIVVTREVDEEM